MLLCFCQHEIKTHPKTLSRFVHRVCTKIGRTSDHPSNPCDTVLNVINDINIRRVNLLQRRQDQLAFAMSQYSEVNILQSQLGPTVSPNACRGVVEDRQIGLHESPVSLESRQLEYQRLTLLKPIDTDVVNKITDTASRLIEFVRFDSVNFCDEKSHDANWVRGGIISCV
jgi:hypothetical protein